MSISSTINDMLSLATVHGHGGDIGMLWIIAYCVLFIIGLCCAAIFSGTETAIYAMSRLRHILHLSQEARSANILNNELNHLPRLITTLLIGNNAANFLMSFAVTAIVASCFHFGEVASIAFEAAVLTPFVFLFSETIPKEIGRTKADSVVYTFAGFLRWIRLLLTWTGFVPLVLLLTGQLRKRGHIAGAHLGADAARLRMTALMQEGLGHGIMSESQINIIEHTLTSHTRPLRSVAIPWRKVVKLSAEDTPRTIRNKSNQLLHSRYPVLDRAGIVIGAIELTNLLVANDQTPAKNKVKPVSYLDPDASFHDAVNAMRSSTMHLIILGSADNPLGIVSRRDILSPLLGSI